MAPPATARYDWILAITTIAFACAAFGNGANDVANSYATSVAARTLTMAQAGVLATFTEFIGAVALGSRVTDTIKNGIISIDRFEGQPGILMLAMGCAEVGNAAWLLIATHLGFPVSTTHTVVGSLIGVGFATQSPITWAWESGSVSQVAASWVIAPAIAAAFSALIFATVKYSVLDRKDSFKWAMRLIPVYIAATAAILALFLIVEAPAAGELEDFGAGQIVGIILGIFAGVSLIVYVFFMPFFERKLIKKDTRLRVWHILMGPLLRKDDVHLFWPGEGDEYVKDYYKDAYGNVQAGKRDEAKAPAFRGVQNPSENVSHTDQPSQNGATEEGIRTNQPKDCEVNTAATMEPKIELVEPEERFLSPIEGLSWLNPLKWWGWLKYILLQGVTRDVVTHDSSLLRAIHGRAHRYDIRVEHLWTYCQVMSAAMMSIAHGSNDVANAVGPWAAVYQTYIEGAVATESDTPVWLFAVAALLLGLGFWCYGYHIVRALGNKITQMSPTRGFAIELGAAITVLIASRLGLPVSTTQSLVGASMGVALMNYDLGAVNWRQLGFIFIGWVLTLPCVALISGLLCLMALNTPHF